MGHSSQAPQPSRYFLPLHVRPVIPGLSCPGGPRTHHLSRTLIHTMSLGRYTVRGFLCVSDFCRSSLFLNIFGPGHLDRSSPAHSPKLRRSPHFGDRIYTGPPSGQPVRSITSVQIRTQMQRPRKAKRGLQDTRHHTRASNSASKLPVSVLLPNKSHGTLTY